MRPWAQHPQAGRAGCLLSLNTLKGLDLGRTAPKRLETWWLV